MQAFTKLDGLVVPIDRANVDTDQIIPKQFLKSIHRTGFGPNLFDDWRYLDRGDPGQARANRQLNTEFALNQERYSGAQILLARENFGCGSSREHAPWALLDFGIRGIVAPSFADIFYNNCLKNGILPVVLPADLIAQWFADVDATPGYRLRIDLAAQTVTPPHGPAVSFDIDAFKKDCLFNGLDDIDLTLHYADQIRDYEARRRDEAPWLFARDAG